MPHQKRTELADIIGATSAVDTLLDAALQCLREARLIAQRNQETAGACAFISMAADGVRDAIDYRVRP